MEVLIRKIGNSKGMVIPAAMLKELGLDVNDKASARTENGLLIIEPQSKKKYDLDELLAECDENAPMPQEFADWDNAKPVGNEI